MACDGAHPPRGSVPIRQPFFRPYKKCLTSGSAPFFFRIATQGPLVSFLATIMASNNGFDCTRQAPLPVKRKSCLSQSSMMWMEKMRYTIQSATQKRRPTTPVDSEDGGTTAGQAELDKWLFVAGWAVVRAQHSAFPAFLAYVQKEYIDQRTYWFSGASPPGIPAATASEPSVNMLQFETYHRMSNLAEFFVDGIPNLGKCWSEHSYALMGRAPLPEPWIWQESQAIHEAATFFDAGDALFFH